MKDGYKIIDNAATCLRLLQVRRLAMLGEQRRIFLSCEEDVLWRRVI
jgi:hypothetical protein